MKLIIIISFFLMFAGCSSVKSIQTLPANYFYKGGHIDIHSPNQERWVELKKAQGQIFFAKKGEKYNESYIAAVTFFPLKATKNDDEFMLLIKKTWLKIGNKERFSLIESDVKFSGKRKYPCAIVKTLLKDNNAKTSHGNEELLMHEKALYCRDPKRKEAGFMIKYSFRGKNKYPNLDLEADSFIKGIEFEEYK